MFSKKKRKNWIVNLRNLIRKGNRFLVTYIHLGIKELLRGNSNLISELNLFYGNILVYFNSVSIKFQFQIRSVKY